MKKIISLAAAAVMALSLAACSSSTTTASKKSSAASASEKTSASEKKATVGKYTIYNGSGDSVTELYIYPTGGDKGENLAGEKGLSNAHAMYTEFDNADGKGDKGLTLEYTTKGGFTGKFTTLSVEEAPITLASEDAASGATNKDSRVLFQAYPATYSFTNSTGENLKSLYVYPTGGDKGENLVEGDAKDLAKPDGTYTLTYDDVTKAGVLKDGKVGALTVEFETEGGTTGKFDHLSYETAPIYLISADARTGATEISFKPVH